MKLYDDNGYVNIRHMLGTDLPFMFCVGGRGTGKTYTSLKTVIEDKIPFLLMRRTQQQVDIINKPQFSPFKKLNDDMGWNIETELISKGNAAFYDNDNLLGYTAALSTISNIRGFDMQDVNLVIYDEFIPESHERPIKGEAFALFNAYETINRNRELNGEKPLQMLCLANSNKIDNPIFESLGLIDKAIKMDTKGQNTWIDKDRGIGLFMLSDSFISRCKAATALYKATANTGYGEMALQNNFADVDMSKVKTQNIREYKLMATVGDISLYSHKSKSIIYVSKHRSGSAVSYTLSKRDLRQFRTDFSWLIKTYIAGAVIFENYSDEVYFCNIFT